MVNEYERLKRIRTSKGRGFSSIWYLKGIMDSDGWYSKKSMSLQVKDKDFAEAFLDNAKLYSKNKASLTIRRIYDKRYERIFANV